MKLPERITGAWMGALTDDQLIDAERKLRRAFDKLEVEEKKKTGTAYDRMRWSGELMLAWDRWTRVNGTARQRGLNPARR